MKGFSGTLARSRAWLWSAMARRAKADEGTPLLALALGGFAVCLSLFLLNPPSVPLTVKSTFVVGMAFCAALAARLWSARGLDQAKMAQAERILVALSSFFAAETDPLEARADLRADHYQVNAPDWLTLSISGQDGNALRLTAGREVKLKAGGEPGSMQTEVKDRLILALTLPDRVRLESFRKMLDQNPHPDMRSNSWQGTSLTTVLQESKLRVPAAHRATRCDVSETSLTRWLDWYTARLGKIGQA